MKMSQMPTQEQSGLILDPAVKPRDDNEEKIPKTASLPIESPDQPGAPSRRRQS